MSNPRRLYLLDAMALAYRAHFIFISRPLINSKGINTSATYGFMSALVKLIEDHSIEHVAVVFDVMGEGGTFRDEMYDAYKAHRDPPPEDLLSNLPFIKAMVEAMDIPVIEREGVEADDVIGTLAKHAEADSAEVVIVSPDKDFQQLISPLVSVFRPAYRGEEFDPVTLDVFREKYGVEPIQFIDILALMGDKADNVPGVPGIGEKGAMKLIQEYGTVEELLDHREEIKGKKAREGLQNHANDALLSKKLVTIKTDVELDFEWETLKRSRPHHEQLAALCKDFEFNTLATRLARLNEGMEGNSIEGQLGFDFEDSVRAEEGAYDASRVTYTLISTKQELKAFVSRLAQQERFAFDTETTSVDPMWASLVGLSFCWESHEATYIPTPLPDGSSTELVLDLLEPALTGEALKVGHNIKYDMSVLEGHGLAVKGPLFDTMIAHYLIAPDDQHNLDWVAQRYLGYRMIPISSLIGSGKDQRSMRDIPVKDVVPYACEDADITFRIFEPLQEELEKNDLKRIAEEIEYPLIPVLIEMERTGVCVSTKALEELSSYMGEEMDRLEKAIYDAAGETFNIASTKQLGHILFEKLELPVVSKTPKGQPSTKESVLSQLATEHALPGDILDWRQLSKLKSTYVDSLGELIHPETGRIHTSYNQTIAATGRLSSSNPNLQNIPIRTPQGREIRKAFIPPDGQLLLAADYVQIELRILASMSMDEALIEAFKSGEDIHRATAAMVYGVEVEEVTADQRRKAKEVNYGIPYGVSAFGLAQRLRCAVSEAKSLIEQYQKSYPAVSRFLAEQVERARENGYAETLMGRRRYVPAIHARNRIERSAAERIAVNMPIQGSQADMIKIAMIRIARILREDSFQSKMIMQVHDELVFNVLPEEEEALKIVVEREMVDALPLEVPIEVDMHSATNWLDAH